MGEENLEKLLVKGSSFVTCFGEFLWELFEFDNTKSDLIISKVLIWMAFGKTQEKRRNKTTLYRVCLSNLFFHLLASNFFEQHEIEQLPKPLFIESTKTKV